MSYIKKSTTFKFTTKHLCMTVNTCGRCVAFRNSFKKGVKSMQKGRRSSPNAFLSCVSHFCYSMHQEETSTWTHFWLSSVVYQPTVILCWCMWKAKNSFVESLLFSHFSGDPGGRSQVFGLEEQVHSLLSEPSHPSPTKMLFWLTCIGSASFLQISY